MPFFKNVFKSKDATRSGSKADASSEPAAPRPRWEDAWSRGDVAPEEIQELVHICTQEMKSRGMAQRHALATTGDNADMQQPLICLSSSFLSAQPPTQARLVISCAVSSRQHTRGQDNFAAKAWRKNCAWPSHWYAQLRPMTWAYTLTHADTL